MQSLTFLEVTGKTEIDILTMPLSDRLRLQTYLESINQHTAILIVDAMVNRQFHIVQILLGIEAMHRKAGYLDNVLKTTRDWVATQIQNGA